MKALVLTEFGMDLEVLEVPVPELTPRGSSYGLRLTASAGVAGICGWGTGIGSV